MVLSEVNQEVESDGLKINPPPSSSSSSDNEAEAKAEYCEEDENLQTLTLRMSGINPSRFSMRWVKTVFTAVILNKGLAGIYRLTQ